MTRFLSKSAPNFENALFLSAHHKFVLALILMKIWDFSYFSSTKTMGIPPTFSFDTTTTSSDGLSLKMNLENKLFTMLKSVSEGPWVQTPNFTNTF